MPTKDKYKHDQEDELYQQSAGSGQGASGQTTTTQSDTVAQAKALLNQNRGGYRSKWSDQISDYLDRILNRDKFSYDVNSDALYQQYADQYARNGQMAMMDTMGRAAALTGGYGNSYAQAAGQQTYQNYLSQLNDVMPELYSMALNQYMNEGDQMNNQLAMMMQQDEIDYGRYQDRIAEQQNNFDRLMALMLQYGYNPTEEDMANAGMTTAQRDAIMGKTNKSGTGPKPKDTTDEDLQGYIQYLIEHFKNSVDPGIDALRGFKP